MTTTELGPLLSTRGTQDDRAIDDLTFLVQVRLAARHAPSLLPGVIVEAAIDRPRLRRARSRPDRIGSYPADLDLLLASAKVWRPLALRLLNGSAAAAVAVGLGFAWWGGALLGLACAIIVAGRAASVLAVVIGISLLFLHPSGWAWTLFAEYMAMMIMLARGVTTAQGGGALGAGLGFLPWTAVVRLSMRRAWTSFSLGIDKAQSDDAVRAEPFLAFAESRAGRYRTVIQHARALAMARGGDATGALTLLADVDPSELPGPARGWCGVVVADILALAGQDHAVNARLEHAIPLLGTRRACGVRISAQLKLVDAAIKQGDLDRALGTLADIRWQAVRRRHADLVAITEGFLVQMMLAVGNRDGAVWTLEQISPNDPRRAQPTESGARSATWNVLHAQVALDAGRIDDAERHAIVAVKRADLLPDLAPRAAANLVLADVRLAAGSAEAALPHVLASLDVLQRIRYGLPASSWRRNWIRLNNRAYELALRIGSDVDDAALIAEVIETIRAQAVPVGLDRTTSTLDTYLSALLDPSADRSASPFGAADGRTRAASAALALSGVDPLRPASAVLVRGTSWVSPSADTALDLDALVTRSVGPDGWYWSACIGGGIYWWATRGPDGDWRWGTSDLSIGSPGRAALDDLFAALPIRRKDEGAATYKARMAVSPLRSGAASQHLLRQVAAAFLPSPVAEVLSLTREDRPTPLLTSLNGPLAAFPINALPVGAQLVIDAAVVSHIPAPAVLAELVPAPAPAHADATGGIALAVVDPDPHLELLQAARAPREAATVLGRPSTRRKVLDSLAAADRHGVFCAFAHYADPPIGDPAAGGLAVADGTLSLRDLLAPAPGGGPVVVPERVLLALCESIAAGARDAVRSGEDLTAGASAWEWLGLSTGFLLAGARHIVATAWPLPDTTTTTRFDHAIARALAGPDPGRGVRAAVLSLIAPGERRDRVPVTVWGAYAYIGPLVAEPPGTT